MSQLQLQFKPNNTLSQCVTIPKATVWHAFMEEVGEKKDSVYCQEERRICAAGSPLHPADFKSAMFCWFVIICLEMIRLSYKIQGESEISQLLSIIVLLYRSHHTPSKSSFWDDGNCSSNLQLSYKIQSHLWLWENRTLPYSFFNLPFLLHYGGVHQG